MIVFDLPPQPPAIIRPLDWEAGVNAALAAQGTPYAKRLAVVRDIKRLYGNTRAGLEIDPRIDELGVWFGDKECALYARDRRMRMLLAMPLIPGWNRMSSGVIVEPGSQSFTSSGTTSYETPAYNTIEMEGWGGGGGGGAVNTGNAAGTGGQTKYNTSTPPTANGGVGGTSSSGNGPGGGGGTASNGDTNTSGNVGAAGSVSNGGAGGNAPASGGSGGATRYDGPGNAGSAPGGGGGGAGYYYDDGKDQDEAAGGGGGSGAYVAKVWNNGDAGAPTAGANYDVVVGALGAGAANGYYSGGNGGVGRVNLDWY